MQISQGLDRIFNRTEMNKNTSKGSATLFLLVMAFTACGDATDRAEGDGTTNHGTAKGTGSHTGGAASEMEGNGNTGRMNSDVHVDTVNATSHPEQTPAGKDPSVEP